MRAIKASMPDREREAFDEPVYIDAKELGTAMLRAYLDRYGEDPDWEVIAVEQPFQIELTRNGRTVAVFAGIFDGAVIDHSDGEPYLMEHKTASSIRTAHLALDDQAGSYFAVATQVLRHQGIIGRKQNIFGIMYNFLRKSKPDERDRNEGGAYLNKDGKVSKRQPPPAFHREPVDRSPREVGAILRRITNEAILMDKVRTGKLPVTKTITDNCPYCPFYTMCVLHERGGNSYLQFMRTNYKIEGPYLDTERKSAAE